MMFLFAGHSDKPLKSLISMAHKGNHICLHRFFFYLRYEWLVRGRLYLPNQHHEPHHKICNLRYGTHGYWRSAYKERWRQNSVRFKWYSFYNNHINPHFLFDCNMIWFSQHPKHSHPQTWSFASFVLSLIFSVLLKVSSENYQIKFFALSAFNSTYPHFGHT